MNFKFTLDEENKRLGVTISVKPKKIVSDPRIRLDAGSALKLIEENFVNDKYKVGNCTTTYVHIDNKYSNKCKDTWLFELIETKSKPTKPVKKATSKSKKATRRKPSKSGV